MAKIYTVKRKSIRHPTFKHERELLGKGYRAIVGVDEAGCGALAGPVVAGAVILPLNSRLGRLHDSKLLTVNRRATIYDLIRERATAWAAGVVSVEEIHQMGIRPATLLAMRRAIEGIEGVDYVLVDAHTLPELSIPQRAIIKGDQRVKSIAAASVIAKVTRDRIMEELHMQWPHFGFAKHKGYGTAHHRQAIHEHGPCQAHRLSFRTFK